MYNSSTRNTLSPESSALQSLRDDLMALGDDSLLEPRIQLGAFLDEARELSAILSRASVAKRIRSVGVPQGRLDALELAVEALADSEMCWATARDAQKSEREIQAEPLAYFLRDEMVAACRFNLDRSEVAELLARVTAGEGLHDLAQDLRELSDFVRDHAASFSGDTSFDPLSCADEAVELARSIAVDAGPDEGARALLEQRDRAFTYLVGLVEQLRQAGRYAYRGTPEARAYFASDVAPARRRRPPPSSVQAVAV